MFKDESEFKKMIDRMNIDTEPDSAHRDGLRRQMLRVFNESKRQSQKPKAPFGVIRRIIMKSPITKLAAAAVIIIAVLIGIHYFGGSVPAFAEVVQPLLTARTATYKMTVNVEGETIQTVKGMFMEPSRMRQEMPDGGIMIIDQNGSRMITLMPTVKKAMIVEMENVPYDNKRQVNMFHSIRELIRQTDDESVDFLGGQKIDGVDAIGYHIAARNMGMTIWADAKTLLPVRIEYIMGEMMGVEGTIIMSDIVFDVEMDELLFEIPEGYDVSTVQFDASMPTEEDFIRALRLWSDTTGGKFPSELNMKATGEFMEALEEKTGLKVKDKAPDPSDPQIREFMQNLTTVNRGIIMFAHGLHEDADWHYTGKEAKFGDVSTAIFWYRPEGSDTYRVIYGDLSVKDVAQENLPK